MNTVSESGNASQAATHPTRWWQWVLVYPTFAISVLGAIPTGMEIIKAHRYDVPLFSSSFAEKQKDLWERNFDCLKGAELAPIVTKHKIEIATHVCESGDVLLVGKRPEWNSPQKRWVAWSDIAPDTSTTKTSTITLPSFVSEAVAADSVPIQLAQWGPATVLCQRWVGNGLLLQRIGTPQGCFDQVLNTYSGWVVRNNPAPCSQQC